MSNQPTLEKMIVPAKPRKALCRLQSATGHGAAYERVTNHI